MQTSIINNQPSLINRSFQRCFPLWILLLFIFSSCSSTKPKLNRPFLPLGYQLDTVTWTKISATPRNIYVLPLNLQKQLNRRVLENWTAGWLNDAFIRTHPLSTVHREDILNLAAFLNHLFTFYLVAIDSNEPISQEQFQGALRNRLKCAPLTNLEIRFQMNAGSQTPFSRKPLTMLMISGHELSLLSGAKPIYPQVFSPYLRDKLKLPPLGHPEKTNLFAARIKNKLYSTPMNGFIVCDRRKINYSPNK
jgi:hypothetical protein